MKQYRQHLKEAEHHVCHEYRYRKIFDNIPRLSEKQRNQHKPEAQGTPYRKEDRIPPVDEVRQSEVIREKRIIQMLS